jgi:hypothetical protein
VIRQSRSKSAVLVKANAADFFPHAVFIPMQAIAVEENLIGVETRSPARKAFVSRVGATCVGPDLSQMDMSLVLFCLLGREFLQDMAVLLSNQMVVPSGLRQQLKSKASDQR